MTITVGMRLRFPAGIVTVDEVIAVSNGNGTGKYRTILRMANTVQEMETHLLCAAIESGKITEVMA